MRRSLPLREQPADASDALRSEAAPINQTHAAPSVGQRAVPLLAALFIAGLTLYAYRALPARLFAADDYQWLLNVQSLHLGELLRTAFDPSTQTHFYRPLVWLLLWTQFQLFGLQPHGYHAVSLALHLLNAALLGTLVYQLTSRHTATSPHRPRPLPLTLALLAAGFLALHPAPFEAVVWVSAQSELLAAMLLLLMLIVWVGSSRLHATLLGTLLLGLALLTKETAVIGFALLLLIPPTESQRVSFRVVALRYLPPALLTALYLVLQVAITQRNYLLQEGGYTIGAHMLLNPLRSLALIVAPLPGTEYARAEWLVPVGLLVALILTGLGAAHRIARRNHTQPPKLSAYVRLILVLGLTLLPTAPFISPPDSRYLYLPVAAFALLLAFLGIRLSQPPPPNVSPVTPDESPQNQSHSRDWFRVPRRTTLAISVLVLVLAWAAAGEVAAREVRFAQGSGSNGSLLNLTRLLCADDRPGRIVVVDPPMAAVHADAIARLGCGAGVRYVITSREALANEIQSRTVVIGFANGSAVLEQRTGNEE